MRRWLVCAACCVACGSSDGSSAPPPLPTSTPTSNDAGNVPIATDAGPKSTTWSGSLAKTKPAPFGGGTYCNYEVVLSNVKVDLTVSEDRTVATGAVTWTMTETTVGTCQYIPQPVSQNSAAPMEMKTAPLANGGFHIELAPGPNNHPRTTLVLESNAGGEATAEWHRDDQVPDLNWTVRATIPLLKK